MAAMGKSDPPGLSLSSACCSCCSVTQSCPVLCDPKDCSTPGLPVHHQLPEITQPGRHGEWRAVLEVPSKGPPRGARDTWRRCRLGRTQGGALVTGTQPQLALPVGVGAARDGPCLVPHSAPTQPPLPLALGWGPQRSLALAEQKCEEWKSQYEALKEDWRTLGTQHRELESQLHVLQSKLQVLGPGGREVRREGRI